jgi:hypothetical protein
MQLLEYREDLYNFFLIFDAPAIGRKLVESISATLNDTIAAEITRQLLSTLVYLHANNFTYGPNLSLDSLLLDVDSFNDENLNIKLADLEIEIVKRMSNFEN